MKRSIAILLFIALILAFNSHGQETAKKSRKVKAAKTMPAPEYPFKASYSSDFIMGNPAHATAVLNLYKSFQAKDWSVETMFADTITAIYTDGSVIKGRAEVMDRFKKYRETMGEISYNMDAIIPLRSADRGEDWVALWGTRSAVMTDGGQQMSGEFQAIWRLNRDGKVDFIKFYEGKTPVQ